MGGVLAMYDIPATLSNGEPDPGLINATVSDELGAAIVDFIAALGAHKHLVREQDPPAV